MKKVLLFSALAGMVTFYSCKKDDKTVTVTNNVHDTLTNTVTVFSHGMINGDSLSTGINVAYGTRVSDSILPAASADANAPVLDTSYSKIYSAVRGRYVTVYPPNVAGYVAGYYVQIVGAKSYFKIDFPAAEGARKAAREAKLARLSKATNGRLSTKNAYSARGIGDGAIDSTLVLKLPASVNGDTFYIKYAAYDLSNRVSKPVTAMVVILPEGSDAMTDSLTGTWTYVSYRNYENGVFQNDWTIDTLRKESYSYYSCEDNSLIRNDVDTTYNIPYYISHSTWQYKLGKYSMEYYSSYDQTNFDQENSSCSNFVYNLGYNYEDSNNGGYSYDPRTKIITFINDGNSNLDLNYDSYKLVELTNSTLVVAYSGGDSADDNVTYFYKFHKN
jgi:hypothetical protein